MKIIKWIKSLWNKKQNDNKAQLSDEELLQKKTEFHARKQAIREFITLKGNQDYQGLYKVAVDILEDIDTAVLRLRCFDKYDLTNPCMTYEEYRRVVVDKCTAQISDMTVYEGNYVWMDAVDIPIEVLVYYATHEAYLQRLLNKCDDIDYQRYCGMFKDDVVILWVEFGVTSMVD